MESLVDFALQEGDKNIKNPYDWLGKFTTKWLGTIPADCRGNPRKYDSPGM